MSHETGNRKMCAWKRSILLIKILDKRFFGSSPAAFAATEDATPTSNTEGKPLKGSGVTHAVSDIRGKSTDFFINRNSLLTLPLTAGHCRGTVKPSNIISSQIAFSMPSSYEHAKFISLAKLTNLLLKYNRGINYCFCNVNLHEVSCGHCLFKGRIDYMSKMCLLSTVF